MNTIKKLIPRPFKRLLLTFRAMLIYSDYDSSEYWRRRASCPGQTAVLWNNEEYNALYRADERRIIEPWVLGLTKGAAVLDVGCGIGVVACAVRSIRSDVAIDAVDFDEMVAIARGRTQGQDVRCIVSSAEDFDGGGVRYDLIISSACYSMIRDINHLKRSLDNAAQMLKPKGILLLLDPFHRWNYLARAKFSTRDVVAHLTPLHLELVTKSGLLFWPYRVRLANSDLYGSRLESKYRRGEKLLKWLGQHFWADYKVLIFRKES